MPPKTAELLAQWRAGQRVWKAPAETKDALVRFQRDVVLPLRRMARAKRIPLTEKAEMFRGARFIVKIEIGEPPTAHDASEK
jgi:hypothetical protein